MPGAYSLALRLRDAGLSDELIAECLAMEPEALEPLLNVAEAKLAAILRAKQGGCEAHDGKPRDPQRLFPYDRRSVAVTSHWNSVHTGAYGWRAPVSAVRR